MVHQRLRAMVAGADRHAAFIENRAEIVRVHAVQREADDPQPILGTEHRNVIHPAQRISRGGGQRALMRGDRIDADMSPDFACRRHNRPTMSLLSE